MYVKVIKGKASLQQAYLDLNTCLCYIHVSLIKHGETCLQLGGNKEINNQVKKENNGAFCCFMKANVPV